jgi:hypothetical protein
VSATDVSGAIAMLFVRRRVIVRSESNAVSVPKRLRMS